MHKRIPEDIRKQSRKISYNTPQIAILFQMKPKKNKISSKEEISFVQKQALMKSSIYVSARNMWKLMLTSRRHTTACGIDIHLPPLHTPPFLTTHEIPSYPSGVFGQPI